MKRRIPRRRGAPTGLLLVVLGLWGALVPFVGPYFDFAMDFDDAWHWTINRLWLEVLPGALVVLGGLLLLGSRTRGRGSLGGLLALAGGVWFVIGPSMSMLWESGRVGVGPPLGGTALRTAEWIGFFYGTGALITLLAAYCLGFLAALPVTGEAVAPAEAAAAADGGTAAPTTATPQRRRGLFRRRRAAVPAGGEQPADGKRPAPDGGRPGRETTRTG